MNRKPLNSKDWRNALEAVCRWKPEEWGSGVIGGIVDCGFNLQDCKERG